MKYTFLFFALFFVFACGERQSAKAPTEVIEIELPEDFETFYKRFHRDSAFQMDHIIFPLEGVPANAASRGIDLESFRWEKEDWVIHKEFDLGTQYQRNFTLGFENTVILENIQHKTSGFGILRRFVKTGEDYFLIYYADMNQIREK